MSTTRTARFVQNTLSTALYQLTAMVMGFITPRLMILYYGSEINGLIVSVTEFLTYFKMLEAGLAASVNVALYEPLARRDHQAVSGIASAARLFYNAAGWMFTGLTVAFTIAYPFFVPVRDLNGLPVSHLSVMVLILAMGLSGMLEFFTMARYRVLIAADQRTYVVSLASMSSLMLSTALIVVLPYLGMDVIVVRLAASLTILVRSVLLSRYARKHYPYVDPHAPPNRAALSTRWDALSVELTNVFQQGAGAILGTVVTRDAGLLSVYGVYHMVTVGLWGILKMGTTGINSIFGNLLVSGRKTAFQRAYRDFECLYYMLVSILFGAAAVLIVPFVTLYTHGVTDAANYDAPLLGMLIIAEAVTNHAKMPMDLMITTSGKFREVRSHCFWQIALTVVCGTGMGLLLMPYGTMRALCGIVAGVCVGNLARTVLQLRFIPKEVTGIAWQKTAWRIVRMFVTTILIAAPCLLLVDPTQRFFSWAMYGVMLVLYASAVTLAVTWLFDRKALRSLLERLTFMLRHIGR